MIAQFLLWYVAMALLGAAALPLALRWFAFLPDRGWAFARPLGVLLTGWLLWAASSYGLLRADSGGAWLALLAVAGFSAALGGRRLWRGDGARAALPSRRYILFFELFWLAAFALWAYVRAHDPAADHTEEPMDLMFMSSIYASAGAPPQDAWLAGYPVSYYYFGYWLLVMVGRLAAQPPEIAYTLGQAAWFALLLTGSFAVVYNLLARGKETAGRTPVWGGLLAAAAVGLTGNGQTVLEWLYANGLLSAQLAARFGVPDFPANAAVTHRWFIDGGWWWWRTARVLQDLNLSGEHIEVIDEFPAFSYLLGDNHPHVLAMPFVLLTIAVALNWLYSFDGRNTEDAEVSTAEGTEFTESIEREEGEKERERGGKEGLQAETDEEAFVAALLARAGGGAASALVSASPTPAAVETPAVARPSAKKSPPALSILSVNSASSAKPSVSSVFQAVVESWRAPLGLTGVALTALVCGSLLFLNTWDFPPYWLLLSAVVFYGAAAGGQRPWRAALSFAAALAVLAALLYLPYFLTAQSQAAGFIPNLFHPTRFSQFAVMFWWALPALAALLALLWRGARPSGRTLAGAALLTFGAPALFLLSSAALALNTGPGAELLARYPIPPEMSAPHSVFIAGRWLAAPFTFLLLAGLLALALALLWTRIESFTTEDTERTKKSKGKTRGKSGEKLSVDALSSAPPVNSVVEKNLPDLFALLLAVLGLGLVFAPEFIYLRDHFGWRMNTVFKFYYQGWLLFGLSGAYAVARIFAERGLRRTWLAAPAGLALAAILAGLIYLPAGAWGKTAGFSRAPSFSAIAYMRDYAPDELAAVAWLRLNTAPDARIAEARGSSYRAETARMSAATGRATLLGWEGHESQWRGRSFGEMAAGRAQALETIYGRGSPEEIAAALNEWGIDYVVLGPAERAAYELASAAETRLGMAADLVFDQGAVKIFRRRG